MIKLNLRSPLWAVLIICSLSSLAAPLWAMSNVGQMEIPTGEDQDFEKAMRERAAKFRLARAAFQASASYNKEAAERLSAVKNLLENGYYKQGRKLAKKARKQFPFSDVASELLHYYIKSYTPQYLPEGKKHKINGNEIYNRINDLWLRYPDYPHMRVAFTEVLQAAEAMQNYKTAINIHADTVQEAVQRSWSINVNPALDLYYFLDRYGDKHVIGPRAKLGIARIYLIQGISSPRKLLFARASYIKFLSAYPNHELVFTALIERAYCYLIAYRGDKYDVGVLMESAFIIKQAELYSAQDSKRIDLIQKLRALIRRSHQDRDFQVAIWYDQKKHQTSAIYYYKEVVKRDPDTAAAKESIRALERLDPQ
ncbi:MAG: hypothetical protein HRU15_01680 [Planctomycetes bacterium]|nr:hypothetical protein [Planctomycetota bacterium]